MNSLKLIFRNIWFQVKWFFKTLFNSKRNIWLSIACLLSYLFTLTAGALSIANTGISVNQTISEHLFSDFSKNSDILGLVYGHESFKETWELKPIEPEKSKKIRSMNICEYIYDVYPANFLGTTPAVVDYKDQLSNDISFMLLPKGGYLDSMFSPEYKFALLAGGTSKMANIEDIYINKRYADFLLGEETNYSSLINKRIELPYVTPYITDGCKVGYVIKGVLDDADEKYQFFRNYIGDFFLANQYLTLPISSCTFFKLDNKLTGIKRQVDALLRTYQYDINLKRFNSIENMFTYEYRIMSFNKNDTTNNMHEIENETNRYFNKYQSTYDYFFYKNNVVKLILCVILTCLLCTVSIFLFFLVTKNTLSFKQSLFFITIITIIAFVVGIFTTKLLFLCIMSKPYISPNSWQAFVLNMMLCLVVFVISAILLKVKKRNEEI